MAYLVGRVAGIPAMGRTMVADKRSFTTTVASAASQAAQVLDQKDSLGRLPGWRIPKGDNEIESEILAAEGPFLLNKDVDQYRPGFFDPPRPWWTYWEKFSLTTRRQKAARSILKQYVNNHPNDAKDDHFFFPTRVEPGFKAIIPQLLENYLTAWDGLSENEPLKQLTTDALFDRFTHSHLAYKAHGLIPVYTVLDKDNKYKAANITLEDCWYTKGLFSSLEAASPVNLRDSFNVSSVLFDGASVDRTLTKIVSNRPSGQVIIGLQVGLNMTLKTQFFVADKIPNKEKLLLPENREALKTWLREASASGSADAQSDLIAAQYTIPRKYIFRFDSHPFQSVIDRRFKLSDVDRQIESEVAERDEAIFTIKPDKVEI